MKKCILCQIVRNPENEKYRIIYTDEKFVAMLVSHPESQGHFMVFPRKHVSEMAKMTFRGRFFEKTVELAERFTKRLGAKAYVMKLNNKIYQLDDNPLHVGHIHMHVVPKFEKASDPLIVPKEETWTRLNELRALLVTA